MKKLATVFVTATLLLNLSLAPLPAWPRQADTSAKGLRAALIFNF